MSKVEDFSSEKPSAKAAASLSYRAYDPDEFRDKVRQNIAYSLLGLLLICTILVAICIIWLHQFDSAKDVALMLFTPLH